MINPANNKYKEYFIGVGYDIVGCILMAIGVKVFSAPNHIAPGGVTGVATLLNYVFGSPIGTLSFCMNIPLLLIAYKKLGKTFTIKTLQTLIIYTIATDFIVANPATYSGNAMLAAIFGGVFNGAGAALVFIHGSTAGGTDIISKLIRKKHPHIPLGQLMLGVNALVMITAAFVYNNIEAALYGLIMSFTGGRVIDALIYGADTGKSCMIVTVKPEEISQAIIERLNRSATILEGKGAYNHANTWVLLCVVRKQEFYPLKNLIKEYDPHAFIIVNEARQIIGSGFKPIDASDN